MLTRIRKQTSILSLTVNGDSYEGNTFLYYVLYYLLYYLLYSNCTDQYEYYVNC